jgi:hypothetical protein
MVGEPGWVPPEADIKRANPARVYDYLLGGTDNFLADQDVGRALIALEPNSRAIVRANRAFLDRAVRFLAGAGIRQFLDVGSGIPTQGNVHEVAQQAAPGARVVYATPTRSRSRIARPSWRASATPRSSTRTCASRRRSSPTPASGG